MVGLTGTGEEGAKSSHQSTVNSGQEIEIQVDSAEVRPADKLNTCTETAAQKVARQLNARKQEKEKQKQNFIGLNVKVTTEGRGGHSGRGRGGHHKSVGERQEQRRQRKAKAKKAVNQELADQIQRQEGALDAMNEIVEATVEARVEGAVEAALEAEAAKRKPSVLDAEYGEERVDHMPEEMRRRLENAYFCKGLTGPRTYFCVMPAEEFKEFEEMSDFDWFQQACNTIKSWIPLHWDLNPGDDLEGAMYGRGYKPRLWWGQVGVFITVTPYNEEVCDVKKVPFDIALLNVPKPAKDRLGNVRVDFFYYTNRQRTFRWLYEDVNIDFLTGALCHVHTPDSIDTYIKRLFPMHATTDVEAKHTVSKCAKILFRAMVEVSGEAPAQTMTDFSATGLTRWRSPHLQRLRTALLLTPVMLVLLLSVVYAPRVWALMLSVLFLPIGICLTLLRALLVLVNALAAKCLTLTIIVGNVAFCAVIPVVFSTLILMLLRLSFSIMSLGYEHGISRNTVDRSYETFWSQVTQYQSLNFWQELLALLKQSSTSLGRWTVSRLQSVTTHFRNTAGSLMPETTPRSFFLDRWHMLSTKWCSLMTTLSRRYHSMSEKRKSQIGLCMLVFCILILTLLALSAPSPKNGWQTSNSSSSSMSSSIVQSSRAFASRLWDLPSSVFRKLEIASTVSLSKLHACLAKCSQAVSTASRTIFSSLSSLEKPLWISFWKETTISWLQHSSRLISSSWHKISDSTSRFWNWTIQDMLPSVDSSLTMAQTKSETLLTSLQNSAGQMRDISAAALDSAADSYELRRSQLATKVDDALSFGSSLKDSLISRVKQGSKKIVAAYDTLINTSETELGGPSSMDHE